MVVTRSERLSGTIVTQNESGVTLKLDEGGTKIIPRAQMLQLFDDDGEILWQAELPKQEYPAVSTAKESRPASSKRTVFGNFMIGGVASGYYREENRLIEAMNITATYSDGSAQSAQTSTLSMVAVPITNGMPPAVPRALSRELFYRSATQTVFTGDGRNYQKITLAEERVTAIHTLMYGRELHFYPANDEVSLDIIAQAGYQVGSYNALATYRSMYGLLTPRPALYTGASDIFYGPTARVGAGISFHGASWVFRLNGYYQAAAAFNAAIRN